MLWKSAGHNFLEGKATKKVFPAHPTPHTEVALPAESGCGGQHWNTSTHHVPLLSWSSETEIPGSQGRCHLPEHTGHYPPLHRALKSQRRAGELKPGDSPHLLEHNLKSSC